MLKLLINNVEFDLVGSAPTLVRKLSSLDIFTCTLSLDDFLKANFVSQLLYVEFYYNSEILFRGYDISDMGITQEYNIIDRTISLTFYSPLCLLSKNFFLYTETVENKLIDEILKNDLVKIESYNLTDEQRLINKEIPQTSLLAWLDETKDLLNFEYWYDYKENICYLGNPEKIKTISYTAQDLQDNLIEFPESFTIDKNIYNRIYLKDNFEGTNFSTIDGNYQQLIGQPIIQQKINGKDLYYIEDVESINNYGLFEYFLDSWNSDKIEASYLECVNFLKTNSKPKINFQAIKIYPKEKIELSSTVKFDFEVIPNFKMDKVFKIADIATTFDRNSNESVYALTIVTDLPVTLESTKLLRKFKNTINKREEREFDGEQRFERTVPINTTPNSQAPVTNVFNMVQSDTKWEHIFGVTEKLPNQRVLKPIEKVPLYIDSTTYIENRYRRGDFTGVHIINQPTDGGDGNGLLNQTAMSIYQADRGWAVSVGAYGAGLLVDTFAVTYQPGTGWIDPGTPGTRIAARLFGDLEVFNGITTLNGNTTVNGTLSKTAGSFKIDHPLDEKNKWLYHSFVESPDMKNIYDGVCFIKNDKQIAIKLPSYFEALNKNFRYQLTANKNCKVWVSQEIKNNKFEISTDSNHVKIYWQVTGIRKDKYAELNRIEVEVDKNEKERGKLVTSNNNLDNINYEAYKKITKGRKIDSKK